jgi:hypothetical protein
MGWWRAPLQALYAAVKLPLLFLSVILASGLLNTMLTQLRGAGLSLREVLLYQLVGLSIAAAVLAGLSPVALFFTLQAPPPPPGLVGLPLDAPQAQASLRVFRALLLLHIAGIGIAGIVGNLQLYRLLRRRLGRDRLAAQVLAVWIHVCGFVGCELSWLFSPFLCKPNFPPHVLSRMYFEGNFYEHVFRAMLDVF